MENEQLIAAEDFCASHHIEVSFIQSLQDYGLVEITTIEDKGFIYPEQLKQLERIVSLHYEMDINLEGIETINHLLQQIDDMRYELLKLRNRLQLYGADE